MQAADLVKYINNPQLLDQQSIGELQKLAADFPYFQPAHLLLSMAARQWDATVYQQSLKKTAIVATNRERLYQLVMTSASTASMTSTLQQAQDSVTGVPEVEPVETAVTKEAEVVKEEVVKPEPEIVRTEEPVVEPVAEAKEEPAKEEPVVEEQKPALNAEQVLEREIEKQVVNAFVEKEILKTPELHHPQQRQEPENFVDWLALLKKNNGQDWQQQIRHKEETPEAKETQETKETQEIKGTKETEETLRQTQDPKEMPVDDVAQTRKLKHRALIDKIIENSPGVIRAKEDQKFYTADNKAKESLLENEHLVTETLAKIYALQGNVNKAVRAYEILSLKFPQKSAYFATLIKKLKE